MNKYDAEIRINNFRNLETSDQVAAAIMLDEVKKFDKKCKEQFTEIAELKAKLMSKDITADLARESKREAKGVSWDLHQRECDRNEALEYEIETLQAKVAELENVNKSLDTDHKWVLSQINNIKANTLLEAANELTVNYWIDYNDLVEYANKLDRSEL